MTEQMIPEVSVKADAVLASDRRALQREAVRLGWKHWALRGGVALIAIWIFWMIAAAILSFGHHLDYSRFAPADSPVVLVLQRANPYIWWAVVVILGLIALSVLRYGWQQGVRRERECAVSAEALRELAGQLSVPAREVLALVWQDRTQPLTLGVLYEALAEMRGGRFARLQLARAQAEILGVAAAPRQTL